MNKMGNLLARGKWLVLLALAACSGISQGGESVGGAGAGGSAGRAERINEAGAVGVHVGGTGGAQDQPVAAAGQAGETVAEAGQPGESSAGAGGEAGVSGQAGAPAGGLSTGGAADAGSAGNTTCVPSITEEAACAGRCNSDQGDGCGGKYHCGECADTATQVCSSGHLCVYKPECDCAAQGLECGQLPDIYSTAARCPVVVQCGANGGACKASQICAVPNTKPGRICETPGPAPDGLCSVAALNPNSVCGMALAAAPAGCDTAYARCGRMASPLTGKDCGLCSDASYDVTFGPSVP